MAYILACIVVALPCMVYCNQLTGSYLIFNQPAPTDEEVAAMLEERRVEKYL